MSLGYWETLASITGDGTALTAAARASLLQGGAKAGLFTLPANKLRIGDVLHLKATGRISSVITTPGTARFDLSAGVGGTAFMDSLAILLDTVQAHSNVGWILDMEGAVRAVGNAANIMWAGRWTCEDLLGTPATPPKGSLTAVLPWNSPPAAGANFDHSVANIIDFNFTQTVATGSVTLHTYALSLKSSTGF